MEIPGSTIDQVESRSPNERSVWARRAFLAGLLVFVLAGLAGFLGVRTDVVTDAQQDYEVSLRHASLARAGFDVPWQVTVRHPGGFGQDLELAVTGDYFDIYETQGFAPEPSESTRDGDTLYLTFDAPEGDTFVLSYDAYIQPSSQIGRDGALSVVVDGAWVATVEFRTRLLP